MFKNKTFYGALLILAIVALTAGCSTVSAPSASASNSPASNLAGGPGIAQPTTPVIQTVPSAGRSITVVGMGKATGTPDVAHISIGVETQADTVQKAVDDNKSKMTDLLSTLKSLGVADKDIQTTNYGVYTQRQPSPDGKGDTGPTTYQVNNQVSVTVRDVNKLGDVLDKVVAAGANNIYGVSFSVNDTTQLEADARAQAMTDAKTRAESLAKLAGVTLGDVVSVSEIVGNSGPVYAGARMSAATGLGGGAPIQPGELEVDTSIQVTFAIK
jgi:uncharacterized protein YggE